MIIALVTRTSRRLREEPPCEGAYQPQPLTKWWLWQVDFSGPQALLEWIKARDCDVIVSFTPDGDMTLEIYDDYRE